jgi:hypothetical protein
LRLKSLALRADRTAFLYHGLVKASRAIEGSISF